MLPALPASDKLLLFMNSWSVAHIAIPVPRNIHCLLSHVRSFRCWTLVFNAFWIKRCYVPTDKTETFPQTSLLGVRYNICRFSRVQCLLLLFFLVWAFFHWSFLVTRRLGGVGQNPCSPAAVLAFGCSFAQISEGPLTPLCRICLSNLSDFCVIVPGFVLISDGIVTPLCRGSHFNLCAKLHGICSA